MRSLITKTKMLSVSVVIAVCSISPLMAAAPSTAFPLSQDMDGVNAFPASSHLPEDPYSTPIEGGSTDSSDAWNESATRHWTDLDQWAQWHQWTLPQYHTMDIRELWVSWDCYNVYIGVQGPNALWDHGDLFIALDVAAGGTAECNWNRSVDFFGWQPDFFISVEKPLSDAAGYADLTDSSHNVIKLFTENVDAADSGWVAAEDGGMFYEFTISFQHLGLTPGEIHPLRLCAYTTHEHSEAEHDAAGSYLIGLEQIFYNAEVGADAYDTAPGNNQGVEFEQLGDYPGDADNATDPGWNWTSSDDTNGTGVSVQIFDAASWNSIGSSPGSDYIGSDTDTIAQYLEITNFGELPPLGPIPSTSLTGLGFLLAVMSTLFIRRRKSFR